MDQIVNALQARFAVVGQVAVQFGGEDAEDLRQDAMLLALREVNRLADEGRTESPASIAFYAIQRIKSGRRSYGASSVDVYAAGTQLAGRARLESTGLATDDNGEVFEAQIVDLVASRSDVATEAARRIDWEAFLVSLSPMERAFLVAVAQGARTTDLAAAAGVSLPAITKRKRALAARLRKEWGDEVLAMIGQPPVWVRERQHE